MAKAYPNSEFHGYDPTAHAIERTEVKAAELGLANVKFQIAGGEDLPDEARYDFIITFDCIHDMIHPSEVIDSIRQALKPDGTRTEHTERMTPVWTVTTLVGIAWALASYDGFLSRDRF